MPYTLDELAEDIKSIVEKDGVPNGSYQICYFVAKALMDKNFAPDNLPNRAKGENPRKVLYEDNNSGFCICGHVYDTEAIGFPHDHGSSWAVYGQAEGETEMTDWDILEDQQDDETIYVKASKTYIMKPGDVHFYGVGHVHSPVRKDPVRLLRIEGVNLDNIKRSNIKAINS
ncbi:hypothetical protein OAT42_00290 [Alphaproteobacteria bacterium]|nr:hypothetical protein [Alphaproteobacteria bacterium]